MPINPDDSDEDENITLQNVNKLSKLLAKIVNGIMQRECINTFAKSFYLEIIMNADCVDGGGGQLEGMKVRKRTCAYKEGEESKFLKILQFLNISKNSKNSALCGWPLIWFDICGAFFKDWCSTSYSLGIWSSVH